MVGLEGAGKITIFFKLKLGEMVTTIATFVSIVGTVEYKDFSFTVWAVGCQDKSRRLRHHCFQDTSGLLYVVDSKRSRQGRGGKSKAQQNDERGRHARGGCARLFRHTHVFNGNSGKIS